MSAKFAFSLLLLVCVAATVANARHPASRRPTRPRPSPKPTTPPSQVREGTPCESRYVRPCGEKELVGETVTQLDSASYGPNVCQTVRVYRVPVSCAVNRRVCRHRWGSIRFRYPQHCSTICVPSGDCNCTREVTTNPIYHCCDGYTFNGSYHKSNRMPRSGCPIKLEETIADCLTKLNLTALSDLVADKEEGSAEDGESFTIFAPTDEAICDHDFTAEMMAAHALAHEVRSEVLVNKHGLRHPSLAPGNFIHFTTVQQRRPRSQRLFVNGVRVVVPNACFARNGVVHVIDGIIRSSNSSIVDVLSSEPDLSNFNELIEKANFPEYHLVEHYHTLTVFAPTNDAINIETMECLCLPENKFILKKFLLFHVVPGAEYQSTLQLRNSLFTKLCYYSFTGYWCIPVSIEEEQNTVIVSGSVITHGDIPASNGVVHIVSRPLQNRLLARLLARCAPPTTTLPINPTSTPPQPPQSTSTTPPQPPQSTSTPPPPQPTPTPVSPPDPIISE